VEEDDPTPFQRTHRGGEHVRNGFTTPLNSQPLNSPSTPVVSQLPGYPFNRTSPSPQRRQLPRTPATGNTNPPRHRVSPIRSSPQRPGTSSSSTQPIAPVNGGAALAAPARGDDTRLNPEPTSSRAGSSHMVASTTLASAVGGVFNPISSSTPARPGSALVVRTSASASRTTRGSSPYKRPALTGTPLPPAIPASGVSAEGHSNGSSQSDNSTNSSGAEGANPAPAPETVDESPTLNSAARRLGRGMPLIPGAQTSGSLDPLRFTGALQVVDSRAPPPATPDRSVRQAAPETPMASSTRYGTEINSSMRHLF
jgi:hypothetical protein